MPEQGDEAPDFLLLDQDCTNVNRADLRGRKVSVHFYPGR